MGISTVWKALKKWRKVHKESLDVFLYTSRLTMAFALLTQEKRINLYLQCLLSIHHETFVCVFGWEFWDISRLMATQQSYGLGSTEQIITSQLSASLISISKLHWTTQVLHAPTFVIKFCGSMWHCIPSAFFYSVLQLSPSLHQGKLFLLSLTFIWAKLTAAHHVISS